MKNKPSVNSRGSVAKTKHHFAKVLGIYAVMAFATSSANASINASVTDVVAKQRYPWNGLVDITCKVSGVDVESHGLTFVVAIVYPDTNITQVVSHFWIDREYEDDNNSGISTNGYYHIIWDSYADIGTVRYNDMIVRVALCAHNKVQLWKDGPYWAETNIGADEPWEYGWYFWWGDTIGYRWENNAWVANDGSSSCFSFLNTPPYRKEISDLKNEGWITEDGILAPEHDAAQVQWGNGWRLPTLQELKDLNNYCDWTWTSTNGIWGYVISGRGNFSSARIFIPAAGTGLENKLDYVGSYGYLWSSLPSGWLEAYGLHFHSGAHTTSHPRRYCGRSIRPVQDHESASAFPIEHGSDSASFLLDTVKGVRIARKYESIAYSTEWFNGSSIRVSVDNSTFHEQTAPTTGDIAWDSAQAGVGYHMFTHQSGGETLTAWFKVLADDTHDEFHALRTWYVAAVSGSDSNDGLSAETAFASIQKAIDSAAWGDRILVGDGVYGAITTTNQLLTIESVNGADVTIIDGRGTTRAAEFGSGSGSAVLTNTFLRGFTIRNGYAEYGGGGIVYGTAEACIVENNTAEMGAGSWGGIRKDCAFWNNSANSEGGAMYYGIAEGCVFSGNNAQYGGAMSYTKAHRCIVSGNSAYLGGAGWYATASNCVFTANAASGGGGVGWYGTYGHCTFYANHAECGGALYRGTAANCIFADNTADYANDTYQANVSYSLASGIIGNQGDGTGVVSGDPLFVNAASGDFRLNEASPCVNAGNPDYASLDTDFGGNPRVRDGRTDMGAFEVDLPDISGIFAAVPAGGMVVPQGNKVLAVGESATYHAAGPRTFLGFYTNGVFAAASSDITLHAQADDILLEARFDITTPITIHVDASQTGDADGRTPTTAFATLQEAVDVAFEGDNILAASGTYAPFSSGDKAIAIRSASGAEETVIDGGGTNRCATMGSASGHTQTRLIGFTLQNGTTSGNGGGSLCGTLEDCVLTGNRANTGGGACRGILRNCTVVGNSAASGGGVAYASVESSTLSMNAATNGWGGGAASSSLTDCIIEGNSASRRGGGTDVGTATRCAYRGNSAESGGGANGGVLKNCLVVNNSATSSGGGCYGAYNDEPVILVNCTVFGNVAGEAGGGIYSLTTDNNLSSGGEDSMCYCAVANNSIVWGNALSSGTVSNYETSDTNGKGIRFQNSCSAPLPQGDGNVSDEPLFVDSANGDFQLAATSPCVNSGAASYMQVDVYQASADDGQSLAYVCFESTCQISPADTDIAGNPRMAFGFADMGAYECQTEPPREMTYEEVWGEWSSEETQSYTVPESVATWDELARVLWQSRDAYVRSGARTEVPPSESAIVLSLGAMSVPDDLMVADPPIETETEHGVPVWRLHVFEDTNTCSMVALAGKTAFEISLLPSYLANAWVNAVYGQPPAWLDANETAAWYTARSRHRIEWYVTLVPQSQWAEYVSSREDGVAAAEEDSEFGDVFVLSGFETATGDGTHSVTVMSSAGGTVRLLGKESLTDSLWDYKGLSMQERGETAAGAVSEAASQFFMATRQTATGARSAASAGDSDGDGIPDDIERLVFGTNPNRADTSGDGLSDWDKAYRLGLNPAVRDTAGDGISDVEKMAAGTDPRVPASPAQSAAAARSIRYTYDDDDRLTGTWFGRGGASTTTVLSPAGNPDDIRDRDAAR